MSFMSLKRLFTIIFPLISAVGFAQESQTGYNFLRLPVSAHGAALGGENITIIEDDAALVFSNPALIASVSDKTIGLNFMSYMDGAATGSASFNRVVKERATWGVQAQYINYGSIKEMNADNVQTGDFTAQEVSLSGTFAYELTNNLVGGITAKFLASYIGDYNAMAMGVDLGLNYYDPTHEWSLSLVAKNLGGELKSYDENYGKMPLDLLFGVSKRIQGTPFRLSATFSDLNHWGYDIQNHVSLGLDLIISPQFYIAGGYNFRRANEMKLMSSDGESSHGAGLSFGGGVLLDRFKLNVAYGKYHVSTSSLLINVAYSL